MNKRSFGELELEILHILKSGKRMSVKQVQLMLGEEQNKYNTIMTVMFRLAKKGVLARERIGFHYEYWLIASETKFSSFIEQFKKKIFGIKTSAMVNYLIESADDISNDEIKEIEQVLEKAKRMRVPNEKL